MGFPNYFEDIGQHVGAFESGRSDLNQDVPIVVDFSSGEGFPAVDQLYCISQGGKNVRLVRSRASIRRCDYSSAADATG